jgi:Fic family protein
VSRHLADADSEVVVVERLCREAMETSAIEGEMLERESVQSSIRKQLGLVGDGRQVGAAEAGVAEMMTALYRTLAAPLEQTCLFDWHRMLMNGRRDLEGIGRAGRAWRGNPGRTTFSVDDQWLASGQSSYLNRSSSRGTFKRFRCPFGSRGG